MNGIAAGRIAGIPVVFDQTFVVLALLYAMGWLRAGSPEYIIVGVFAVVGGAASILAHEFAHAAAGRFCGVTPLFIELNGLGGACHFDRVANRRAERVFITLAGPAANFLLWAVFLWLANSVLAVMPEAPDDGEPASGWFRLGMSLYLSFSTLSSLNIAMCIFNLLPSFPLDGGKAMSELFAAKFDLAIGTRIIATLGFAVSAWCIYQALTTGSMWMLVLAYTLFLANQQAMETLGRRKWQRWN